MNIFNVDQPLLVTSEDARGDTNHEKEEIRRSSNLNKHFAVQQSKENILKSHNEFSSHVVSSKMLNLSISAFGDFKYMPDNFVKLHETQ